MRTPVQTANPARKNAKGLLAAGWLAMILLSSGGAAGQDLMVSRLLCQGNEPFWSFRLSPGGGEFSALGQTEQRYSGSLERLDYLDPPWSVWRGRPVESDAPEGETVAVLRAEACQDTMSDEAGPFDRRVVISRPDGTLLTGCCRSAVGLDTSEARLADFEDIQRDDWSRFLPRLAPAVEGCMASGFSGPVERLLGAWPLPRGQVLVRAALQEGGREDCIAGESEGEVLFNSPVAASAARSSSEGAPSFYWVEGEAPLVSCGRLEKVVLAGRGMIGWLHYEGPDCRF